MTVLNIVLPVFLVIGLGWGLRRGGFLSAAANNELTRLVYWVAAPALLFRSAASVPVRESLNPAVLGVMTLVTVVMAVVAYLAAAFRSRPSRRGVIAQGVVRSNQVFLGLPLVYNAWGPKAVGQVAVLVGLLVIVYNVLSVPLLTLPHRKPGANLWADAWGGTAEDRHQPAGPGQPGRASRCRPPGWASPRRWTCRWTWWDARRCRWP